MEIEISLVRVGGMFVGEFRSSVSDASSVGCPVCACVLGSHRCFVLAGAGRGYIVCVFCELFCSVIRQKIEKKSGFPL